MPTDTAIATPAPSPRPARGALPSATVVVQDEQILLSRLRLVFYGSDLQRKRFVRTLARRFHGNGKVFWLKQPPDPPCWSVPAIGAYPAVIYAMLAAEPWIRVIWEAEVRGC